MTAGTGIREHTDGITQAAAHEKRWVALTSVGAAVLLTGMKLVVGLLTGSLGLLAEAAHSGLDLVAAVITFLAVRVSDRPADVEHHYGHGKVENLSALIETLLLLATCVWIIYEGVERLFFKFVPVEATIAAFVVIAISIVVDIGRSRALMRVARKHNSQALEADALHFGTDVWSSIVVFLGLVLVKLADLWPGYRDWLLRADSVAALVVAVIVIWVSCRLGRRTIDALLDRAPSGLKETVESALGGLADVLQCRQVRLRQSGNQTFIDLVIGVRRGISLERSHEIALEAEHRIQEVLPSADVVVHVDPVSGEGETMARRIRDIAANHGQMVHHVIITEEDGRVVAELHIEVDEELALQQAHAAADAVEAAVLQELPTVARVVTHIEPAREQRLRTRDVTGASDAVLEEVKAAVRATPGILECHDIEVRRSGEEIFLTMHCTFAAGRTVREVHDISTELERRLRREIPHLTRVTTHAEPLSAPL